MRYKKLVFKEEGFLILESLLTLMILLAVITVLLPLIVNWLAKHQESGDFVEENRQLYERSILLNNESIEHLDKQEYMFEIYTHCIQIKESGTEVVIYETVFEE